MLYLVGQFKNMLPSRNPKKVLLIVDNSLLIIERLLSMLKEVKTVEKIFTAVNYNEAVAVLTETKTDIVLLDFQLTQKNGIELLKFIIKNYPVTKVIILSNEVSERHQKLCKKIGAAYFIDKSKNFELMPEVVDAI